MLLLIIAALAGGYYVYDKQQKDEAARAAVRQQKIEEQARKQEEELRRQAEQASSQQSSGINRTALGTALISDSSAPANSEDNDYEGYDDTEETAEEEGEKSALGSTTLAKGSGELAIEDTSAPAFDLSAKGKASIKVAEKLAKAIDKASIDDTFHDLQADLKRSFEVACPDLFADSTTLPAFPDKDERLLRIAQGVYVCLNLAAELDAQGAVPVEKHAKFVNWLMKDKAKAARTFTYGLEHCGVTDVATATRLLDELRSSYLKTPSSALKKIPDILKKEAGK